MQTPVRAHAYRPDIDGLRALAVIPVVLFHAKLFPEGGFVGVDIFFVISGYLITQIIRRDLSAGAFSVLTFYSRRIKRIFPAMFLMLFAVSVAGLVILTAPELAALGKSMISVSAFFANILYYNRSGYFEPVAEANPLLHMWTLSVEEQFYIFWPLLCMAMNLSFMRKWRLVLTGAVVLASLAISVWWTHTDPRAAYFQLPSRAFELGIGALAALLAEGGRLVKLSGTVKTAGGLIGLALIAFAYATYTHETPFPGLAGLSPCVGAALIILSSEGQASAVGRVLAWRPLVSAGLISYSLYLWHWPLIVYTRMMMPHDLGVLERGLVVVVAMIMAWLSWKYVETPVRQVSVRGLTPWRWAIFGFTAITAFCITGGAFAGLDGLPGRAPEAHAWLKKASADYDAFMVTPCLSRNDDVSEARGCLVGKPSADGSYNAILWGDSHAQQFAPLLADAGEASGLTFRVMTKAGCAPIYGVRMLPASDEYRSCETFKATAHDNVQHAEKARIIVIAARWDAYAEGQILVSRDGTRTSLTQSRALFVSGLRQTLTDLTREGKQVILIAQVPLPQIDPRICITRAKMLHHSLQKCSATHLPSLAVTETATLPLLDQAMAGMDGVQLIVPHDTICKDDACALLKDDKLVYMDSTHLSPFGAHLFDDEMTHALDVAKQRLDGAI